ncbi:MAG: c-type cytochrome [Betaproteobacteria bacterium]
MNKLLIAAALAAALAGCSDKQATAPKAGAGATAPAKLEPGQGDKEAGRKIAETDCKSCHGLDGKGVAPAIPHLAGQRERYLLAALSEYKSGNRTHAALRQIAAHLNEADTRNIAAYYSSLPPIGPAAIASQSSPYDQGKAVAEQCSSCHGNDGNATTAGIPSLAGQQPRYLVAAINEYLNGERKTTPMHAKLRGISRIDIENVSLYFASQAPATRTTSARGDPKAGEPLSSVCGGCHGMQGVSADSATPSLAGQDEQYLVESIKAYRTSRKRENMRTYVQGLSDKDIGDIAAFYAVQKSRAPEKGQTLVQEYTERCNRCHGPGVDNPSMPIPRIQGQDKDYLVMALREYRDDRRESTTMHKMSLPYGDSIIDSIASYYASQPAK